MPGGRHDAGGAVAEPVHEALDGGAGSTWMASGCCRAGTGPGARTSISSIGVGRGISKTSSWPMRIRMGATVAAAGWCRSISIRGGFW